MAQVSNQTQLLSALAEQDSSIQITSDFSITSQIDILYPVTIESADSSAPSTLTKDASYFTYLFRVQRGGSLTLQNIILDGNKSSHPTNSENNRSLIYVTGGTLNMLEGSVVQNNNSYLEGGGIYLNRNASIPNTLTMSQNARIANCYSRTNGGGIMIAAGNPGDSFQISGTVQIEDNQSVNGGGIYCRGYAENIPTTLTISDQAAITNNNAGSFGGGLYFSGFRSSSAASELTLSGNVRISGNQAAHGAGIYTQASSTEDRITISSDVLITQNTASQNGGGCNIQANGFPANVSVTNASIINNTAGTGGGMYLLTDSGAALSFSGSTFSDNKAVNGASGTGGGIWIKNQSQDTGISATLTDTTMENNQASAHAGAMALYAGGGTFTFQMSNCTTSKNNASQEGGGLVISSEGAGALTFDQSVFDNNIAGGSGGGIYYANTGDGIASTFTMTDNVVAYNTAGTTGGGLRLSSGTGTLTTLLNNCSINFNTAQSSSGGGIWNGGSNDKLTLTGSTTVIGNKTQSGNGGGIYFNSDQGTMLLTGKTQISENSANEVSTDFGNHGGGICLVPGILTIEEEAEISSNTAGKYGGGISAAEGSQIIMQGGTIQNNSSGQFGGGIWNSGNSTAALTGGSISNNKALQGNDIYNNANLYMKGTRILMSGVCITSSDSTIKLIGALAESSDIQLESSSYVTPNPEGNPIVVGEATNTYPQLTQTDADGFTKPQDGFDGWEIRLSTDNTQILIAPVVYKIEYENLMGAVNPNPDSYTVTSPTIELMPLQDMPGYRFIGWFDSLSGGKQITSIPQGSSGNITLYARWEKLPESYTITFCGNDECCPKAYNIPEQITVQGKQEVTLPAEVPQRKTYCFQYWNTNCSGCGTSYFPGETIPYINSNLNLYAIWKRNKCGCPCPSFSDVK